MSIYKLGDTWWIQFTAPNGERVQKSARTSVKKEIEGKLSSGTAAAWLGIGRLAFLRLACEAGVTLLEDTADDYA